MGKGSFYFGHNISVINVSYNLYSKGRHFSPILWNFLTSSACLNINIICISALKK